jgi:hypothetical protein
MTSLLLGGRRDAMAHFRGHPVNVPRSKEESSGLNHL